MNRPWMKWFPRDWRSESRLRMCSLSARGLWIELIGYMHEAEPYGHFLIGGKSPSLGEIACLVGRAEREVSQALDELLEQQVCEYVNGTIISRRMVRDKAKYETDVENGKGGGNPHLIKRVKGGVNPPGGGQVNTPDKAHIPYSRSQNPEKKDPDLRSADPRADLFNRGLEALARMTGKTPDSCRSIVGKWLKTVDDEAIQVLGAIDDADRNRIADPVAWISKSLKPRGANGHGRVTVQQASADLVDRLRALDGPGDIRGREGAPSLRLLPEG